MSLKKEKISRGIQADYWKIVDCNVKTGFVGVALYVDRDAAQTRENMIEGRIAYQVDFPIDVSNPVSYAYTKIKESKKGIDHDTEEEIETNFLADAEDI
jgi:hypothetical protein